MEETSEKMRTLYDTWQQSGLSRKAFCKRENISYATFYYWQKRFSAHEQTGFTEIPVPIQEESDFRAELIFPSGVRMVFPSAPPILWLKELIG